jgi:pyrroline-5-carboxylate reductase
MPLTQRVAFIGAGNMAAALIEGLISSRTCAPSAICASDTRGDALRALAARHGFTAAESNAAAAREADIVVLAVKPQVFAPVLTELAGAVAHGPLVISIAAGVPISAIEAKLGGQVRVVRAMPNTPALVAAGATAITAGTQASDGDLELAETLFRSVGIVVRVEERYLDAVTALSGSGPGYVFLLVEALSEAGVKAGLPSDVAAALAAQTVYGAGKLLHGSSEPPATLRRNVTSPGGTTQAGIERLEAGGLRDIVADAVLAAARRGAELGAEIARKV